MGDASSREWQGIVCRHGLLLVQGDPFLTLQKSALMKGGVLSDEPFDALQAREAKMILLGAPRDSLLLTKESGEFAQPHIRVVLADALAEALSRPSFQRTAAMTHSGPRDPDKPCNQDFAVAADLLVGGKAFSVAVVCDGVSQKVFWPERSSRIAALAALQALYGFLLHGAETSFPEVLQSAITNAYREDRKLLGDAPSLMFDRDYYARQREREANWYQSTVLVAALGGDGGFVSYVGDGAIVDLPRNGTFDPKLVTTEDFGLDHCASLLLEAHEFEKAVRLPPGERTLLLATDGIDRTAAASGSREDFFRAMAAQVANAGQKTRGEALFTYLEQTSRLPYCASDNISVAWLTAPDARVGGEIRPLASLLDPPPAPPPPPPPPPPLPPVAGPPPQPPDFIPASYSGQSSARPAGAAMPRTAADGSASLRNSQRQDRPKQRDASILQITLIGLCMVLLVAAGFVGAMAVSSFLAGKQPQGTAASQPGEKRSEPEKAGGQTPENATPGVIGTPADTTEEKKAPDQPVADPDKRETQQKTGVPAKADGEPPPKLADSAPKQPTKPNKPAATSPTTPATPAAPKTEDKPKTSGSDTASQHTPAPEPGNGAKTDPPPSPSVDDGDGQ
jgi:hypothetical protein